ncbi:helix-turn-helix transcriptional regulator [Mangrovicoccus ximenensis]|uniref:helix-turn-helix transcriptional regulator n=1 Tax=Mangrovicoccus ximenensis TaxID=1911570 RepID=UPI000D39A7B3|nr:helix-turn-helix transcriptional regulator [Mangrovicoccus ximenensis]
MTEAPLPDPRLLAFSANLRRLCEQQGSISRICRKIGINRQQFNKYLAGRHTPSTANIRAIANHFGLDPEVMFSPEEEFRALIDGDFFDTFNRMRRMPQVAAFLSTAMAVPDSVRQSLVGVYDRYHYSSIYPRRILRASMCIYAGADLLQHVYVERFPHQDDRSRTAYRFRYHGFVLPIEGRIFTLDFETEQRNEMTFGIYSQIQRNTKSVLLGITSGIAANMYRQPFSTRQALHYRRPGLLSRQDLARTSALDFTDPSIPAEVRDYLGTEPEMIKPG